MGGDPRAEERLLDPEIRGDPDALDALLDPEFTEIGQRGRVWDRETIVAALKADPAVPGVRTISDFIVRRVAPGVVLATYTLPEGNTRRSSLWRQGEAGWRMLFHQGTRIAG